LTRAGILNAKKAGPRKRIEELSENYPELRWIEIINNPWFDFVSADPNPSIQAFWRAELTTCRQ